MSGSGAQPVVRRAAVWLALAALALAGCAEDRSGSTPAAGVAGNGREPAPDFTLESLDGGEISLSDFRGKTVIIDFWATWCPPCVRTLPTMSDVAAEYKDRGVEFFAVDIGETPDEVRAFLEVL